MTDSVEYPIVIRVAGEKFELTPNTSIGIYNDCQNALATEFEKLRRFDESL